MKVDDFEIDLGRSRPRGSLAPYSDRAKLALKALTEDRLEDAQKHIRLVSDHNPLDSAWRLYLAGCLKIKQQCIAQGKELLLQCASLIQANEIEQSASQTKTTRLRAAALHDAGWTLRRLDRPTDAYKMHLEAFQLRLDTCSLKEIWDTAYNLALDAKLSLDHSLAEKWLRTCIELGKIVPDDPHKNQAVSWTHLARTLEVAGRLEEAVQAMRNAKEQWRQHDAESVDVVKADRALGEMLLNQAASPIDASPVDRGELIDEAIGLLTDAREGLLAFGSSYISDARRCDEQRDFAVRLREAPNL